MTALVILSGGQDSTTCLYWAMAKFGQSNIVALSFDYGQKHKIELQAAKKISQIAQIEHHILPINTLAVLGGNALTQESITVEQQAPDTGLPNTFVAGRNLIFFTLAAAFAYQRQIHDLVVGVGQTDYSGYPDCRQNTLESLEQTLKLGMEYSFKIHAPLMFLSKAETVKLAIELHALEIMAYTHTCYNGQVPPCGQCVACQLRAKGFVEAGIADPLLNQTN